MRFIRVGAPGGCTRDEGGPLGACLQEQALNHFKLRWLKARVVSDKEKYRLKTLAGVDQEAERKRAIDGVSKINKWRRNGWLSPTQV